MAKTVTRDKKIIVRLTDKERKRIDREAARAKTTASNFVRKMLGFPPVSAARYAVR